MFTLGQRIRFELDRRRIESRVRGWKKGAYVLADLDFESPEAGGLKSGREFIARFVYEGKSYGFITSMSQILFEHGIAVLAYPQQVDLDPEIRDRWFPASAQAHILRIMGEHDLEEWKAPVSMISMSGLKIVSKQELEKGAKLFVTFTLPTGEKMDNAQTMVRKVSMIRGKFELSLDYVYLTDENKQALDKMIEVSSSRSGLLK